jgi:transcription antitermination protein NusB
MTPPGGIGARRRARECALQMLYSLDVNPGLSVDQVFAHFWKDFAGEAAEERDADVMGFAERLVRGAQTNVASIDDTIQRASKNWRLERMARVDRNLLRLGTYELRYETDVPARVVINEAIELAKRFGTAESPAFVNGLLDRISQELARSL